MAIYHLNAKVVSRGKGQSAVAAAAYRSGEQLTDEQTGELKSYERRALRIIHTEIMAAQSAPDWVRDRNRLWNEVERFEKRKDARVAREIEVSLPHELTEEQRKLLVKDFAREAFTRHGYVVDIAIHTPEPRKDQRNHHAHLMITPRPLKDGEFAPLKDASLNAKDQLTTWREQWANLANRHLARHGHDVRIDHRSLKEQGIDREATTHVGYAGHEIAARGAQSDRMDEHKGVLERNGLRAEVRALDEELAQLQELAANENRKLRTPEPSREPRPMLDGPTDDELKQQPQREGQYLAHMQKEHKHATALLDERQRAKELDDRAKAFQAAKEIEAEDGRKKKAEQDAPEAGDGRNGDISSASARYSVALGQTYDVRDPYASLAKAAGAEAAMFHKNQEQLRAAAAKEADPDKRNAIELRRRIEGCDYMAVTNDRLAGISAAVTGRPDNKWAIEDKQQAAHYRAMAAALREERSAVLDKVQANDAIKEQLAQQVKETANANIEKRRGAQPPYRSVMPATAAEPEPTPKQAEETERTKTKGERSSAGEAGAMPAPQRQAYRQTLSAAANEARPDPNAELRVLDRDGKDVGTLSAFLQREQPRTGEPYKAPPMRDLINKPQARVEHERRQAQAREERINADKALGRIGSDLKKGRTVQADDLRSLPREQWDSARVKGEAGLKRSIKEVKDQSRQNTGRTMGAVPRRLEP